MTANTLFLRLEGPLQAWGNTSKFVIRRCMDAPTKSSVLGLICCAMGLSRDAARERLPELNRLAMGVRIDRAGTRWWDWNTVGAKIGIMRADGKGPKKTASTGEYETLITRREYLADASFLVALQGDDAALIQEVADALAKPKWPLYLGRKCCPPALPVFAGVGQFASLDVALGSGPWCPRYLEDTPRDEHRKRCETIDLDCLVEWQPRNGEAAPAKAEVWYDTPVSFDPPVHQPRLVLRQRVLAEVGEPLQHRTPSPQRSRTDYDKSTWGKISDMRRRMDNNLCVFCKSPATTVQHVNYRQAGKEDNLAALADPRLAEHRMYNLRSLCRLCHDAVTMIEYGLGMGLDRIDPCEPRWRDDILRTRGEIVRFRSEEGRRRALRDAPNRVRRELLEEED